MYLIVMKNFTYHHLSFITFAIISLNFKMCKLSVSIFYFIFIFLNFTHPLGFSVKSCQNFQNTPAFLFYKKNYKKNSMIQA
jgi:hypothetical protein